MKNKIRFLFLTLLLSISSCSAQKLDISIKHNSKNPNLPPIYYWVNNNTGENIPNVEYVLNDSYFYKSDLPASGDSLNLFEFAKRDGTRYDFFSIKPIELKVKSKKGSYSVKFDDIPLNLPSAIIPSSGEYRDTRDVLQWYQDVGVLKIPTADTPSLSLLVDIALGYTNNDKATLQELSERKIEIIDFLKSYFKSKTAAELRQEEKIKIEIKHEINDSILTKNKIKDVRFTEYDITEP